MKNTPTSSSAAAAFEGLSADERVTIIERKSDVVEAQQKRIAILEKYLRLERGRRGLSKNLPRYQVHFQLSDEEKAGTIDTFYTVVKEELDIQRPKARVIEYLQEKAVFLDDSVDKTVESVRRVVSAPLPKHPLNKGIASIGLLSYIIVAKFCDGLSPYRIEKRVKRYGGDITRTSLTNWVIPLGDILEPLVTLAQNHQCTRDDLQMDETRIKVLKETNTAPHSKKWMWIMKGGPPDKPTVVFHYDLSRSAKMPARLLKGFQGYLQCECDSLSSYDLVSKNNGLIHIGCWAHARRQFKGAVKAQPKKKAKPEKPTLAEEGLRKIAALYRLERQIKGAPAYEKYQKPQKIALPLLDELKQWLNANIVQTVKGGLTCNALYYTPNQWEKLVRYLSQR